MVDQTPSQAIIAYKTATITDERGRTIIVRKLKPIDELHLLEIVGGTNERYVGLASLAYSVSSIDGVPVGRLATKLQLEGLVKELDTDGFEAVAKAINEQLNPLQKTSAEIKEAAKNE